MTERRPPYRARPLPAVQTSPRLTVATLVHWTDDTPPDLAEIALDSESWFAWLKQGHGFRVTYNDAGQSVTFGVTPERRGNRMYWAGYKRVGGKLQKHYIGATAKLTHAALNAAGAHFLAMATELAAADPTAPLRDALADYEALVSQLLAHLPANLRRHARREMGRIKDVVGN